MNRRLVTCASLAAVAALGIAPAHAATTKPKPKPINKTYALTLPPDPTPNATNTAGMPGCTGLNPASTDKHPFTVPAKGTLKVVLDSPDPTGHGVTDWDLYVLDSDGSILDSSHGGTSHEETFDKFKKKNPVTFWVCNLAGEPDATVHFTFTYT
jgi:hypothetical protein